MMTHAPVSCQSSVAASLCSRATSELLSFNLFTALIFLVRSLETSSSRQCKYVSWTQTCNGLLLCNLATLQCYSCATTKRCRPSPFQRRAQNVNHPRHPCDFGKRLYLIDMTRCGNINDDSCSRIVPKQCCGQLMLPRHFRAVVFQLFRSPDFARVPFGNIVFSRVQVCFLDSYM